MIIAIFLFLFSVNSYAGAWRTETTLFSENEPHTKKWTELAYGSKASLKKLISLISQSSYGKSLINKSILKAKEQNKKLLEIIKPAKSSYTDSTLVRRYKVDNPSEIEYAKHSKIFINENLNTIEAMLDLVHELTHFAADYNFNPYSESFNAKDFVKHTVEGHGGEVDAYMSECTVLKEIFPKRLANKFNCHLIKNESGQISRSLAVEQFYKVGEHYRQMEKKSHKHGLAASDFPKLSEKATMFFSSAYGLPYPVAALKEYEYILSRVCANDSKRLAGLKDELATTQSYNSVIKEIKKIATRYESKCSQPEV